jgi:pyridoxamine 5'-phosphate oxidase
MSESPLDEGLVDPDPIVEVRRWLEAALAAGIPNADAMVVATATPVGEPSARVVLLRGLDARGFVFFTNYESRKARELEANPRAALVLYWEPLGRQVRVTGTVARASKAESEAYFTNRPPASRLGAWASPQSRAIGSRDELEGLLADVERRFGGSEPPVPPFWGGYRVTPETIELWKHRDNRLHDRVLYARLADGGWRIERLAP